MNRREAILALLAAPAAILGIRTEEEVPFDVEAFNLWNERPSLAQTHQFGGEVFRSQWFTGCRVLPDGEETYTMEFVAHPPPDGLGYD